MRRPHALQPLPAPGKVARQPWTQRQQGEHQGEEGRHHQDEALQVIAETRQRPACAGERVTHHVLHPGADQRDPGERFAEGAPALDHALSAVMEGAAGLGEAGQQLEELPRDVPPEDDPDQRCRVRDLFLQPCDAQLAPDLDHRWPPAFAFVVY